MNTSEAVEAALSRGHVGALELVLALQPHAPWEALVDDESETYQTLFDLTGLRLTEGLRERLRTLADGGREANPDAGPGADRWAKVDNNWVYVTRYYPRSQYRGNGFKIGDPIMKTDTRDYWHAANNVQAWSLTRPAPETFREPGAHEAWAQLTNGRWKKVRAISSEDLINTADGERYPIDELTFHAAPPKPSWWQRELLSASGVWHHVDTVATSGATYFVSNGVEHRKAENQKFYPVSRTWDPDPEVWTMYQAVFNALWGVFDQIALPKETAEAVLDAVEQEVYEQILAKRDELNSIRVERRAQEAARSREAAEREAAERRAQEAARQVREDAELATQRVASSRARVEANLRALGLAATRDSFNRQALLEYSGWGGLGGFAYDEAPGTTADGRPIITYVPKPEILERWPKGWPEPNFSGQINEYYTPPSLARMVAQTLAPVIDPKSRILEPSAGVGRFIEPLRDLGKAEDVTAIELSLSASAILETLYQRDPGVKIHSGIPFERWCFDNAHSDLFDIVVANPPYGARIGEYLMLDPDREYQDIDQAYVYFMRRAQDMLAPNGIGAWLVPGGFLSSSGSRELAYRGAMITRHHLIGAYKLPWDLFPGANLDIDLMFWMARPAWVTNFNTYDQSVLEGRYFAGRRRQILGKVRPGGGHGGAPYLLPFLDGPVGKDVRGAHVVRSSEHPIEIADPIRWNEFFVHRGVERDVEMGRKFLDDNGDWELDDYVYFGNADGKGKSPGVITKRLLQAKVDVAPGEAAFERLRTLGSRVISALALSA